MKPTPMTWTSATMLLLLATLAVLPPSHANPSYWIYHDGRSLAQSCTDGPSPGTRYGGHPGVVADSTTTFVILVGNSAVTSVCPGVNHTIEVNFVEKRKGLLRASAGEFAAPYLGTANNGCVNRQVFWNESANAPDLGRRQNWTAALTVPCSASGTVQLFLTSAASATRNLEAITLTLPVNADCTAASCALPAAASPPPQVTAPLGAPPPLSAPPRPPATSAQGSCPSSSLGYQCSQTLGSLTLHWSLGVAAPAGHVQDNSSSTGARRRLMQADSASETNMLHMAAAAATTGYVGVAFTSTPGQMGGSDIVLGWVASDGTTMANTFHADSADLGAEDQVPFTWASNLGVTQDGGATTLRFSRALNDTLSSSLDVANGVGMNWAVGADGMTSFLEHVDAGGATLDLASGGLTTAASTGVRWVRAHGVLMSVAWMLLLPLGTLLPAHRWALGEARWGGKDVWFVLHVACQTLGTVLFVAGFIIAFTAFNDEGGMPGGACGTTHQVLGIIVMGLLGLQVLAAFVRPAPDAGLKRSVWNLVHHNLGRLSILTSWVVIYLGIYIFHASPTYQESLAAWMVPVASVNGLVVLLGLALLLLKLRRDERFWSSNKASQDPSSHSSNGTSDTRQLPPPSQQPQKALPASHSPATASAASSLSEQTTGACRV